jgi:hypothetical protein
MGRMRPLQTQDGLDRRSPKSGKVVERKEEFAGIDEEPNPCREMC